MARQVSAIAESMFDAEIKHVFADVTKGLRETVRVKTGVVGATYNFPLMGKGMAHERVKYTDVTPMNVGYTQKGLSCNASHPCTYKNRRTLKIAKRKKNINST